MYDSSEFRKIDADSNPFKQFELWFRKAREIVPLLPEAMTLATTSTDGKPSARMVLLKHFDENGFVFFTDYRSPKSKELDENPKATLVFHWRELGRQVRISGPSKRISLKESKAYFQTRPRTRQIACHASKQSQPLESREHLERLYSEISKKFESKEIPLPYWWGGYRLAPVTLEFWQHRENRLHDRILYNRESRDEWSVVRLSP